MCILKMKPNVILSLKKMLAIDEDILCTTKVGLKNYLYLWVWSNGSAVKSTGYSSRGPIFNSQNSHGSLKTACNSPSRESDPITQTTDIHVCKIPMHIK